MSGARPAYEPDDAGVLMRPGYRPPHDYSDGAGAEAYLRDAVLAAHDLSDGSEELVRLIRDWPSEYHFSAARSTLLAPFDFTGLEVLEVGAGCGALTRALGEAGARVTALEGSPERARIAAARCRDLPAVQVVCDDFAAYQPERPVDAVLLIGVLEYAPLYFDGPDPVGAALEHARGCLTDDGALILAIENQLGLKYFAGCAEDHTGRPFYGIEDRYREARGPVTFGNGELRRRLSAAGFSHQRFAYPFPDYKLPRLLLAEEALTDPRLNAGRLAGCVDTRDYLRPRARLFSEEAAWEAIGRNGLVGDFANSFLVAAATTADAPLVAAPPWLAELRATDRVRAYRTVTRILDGGAGALVVRKAALAPAEPPPDLSPVTLGLPIEGPFLQGRPLAARVRDLAQRDGATVDELAGALRPWGQLLRDTAAVVGDERTADRVLPHELLDLVPWNLMDDDAADGGAAKDGASSAALQPFDQEWISARRLTLGQLVFRGLFHLLSRVRTTEPLTPDGTVGGLLAALAAALGVPLDAALLAALTRREAEIQNAVSGMPFALALESLERALERPTAERLAEPSADGGAAEAARVISTAERVRAAAAEDLRRRRAEASLGELDRRVKKAGTPPAGRDAKSAGLVLQRLSDGSQRKLRAFASTARSDGVAPAVASAARSLRNSALYWTGNAPAPAAADDDGYALQAGPPSSWRPLPPSTRRVDVALSLAGASGAEAIATLGGLLHQSHLLYDVVMCVDATTGADAVAVAEEAAAADPRFTLMRPGTTPAAGGDPGAARVAALAAALDATSADIVLLVAAGDQIHGQTLAEFAHALDLEPRCTLVYADTGTPPRRDRSTPEGWLPGEDFRKPDWSPDYLLSTPYLLGCVAISRELYRRAGGLAPALGAGAEYDLVLRAAAAGARVRHIGRVLLRREGALPPGAPSAADADAHAAALSAAAARLHPPAAAVPGLLPGAWRLTRPAEQRPPVTLVIVSGDPVSEIDGRGSLRVLANFLRSLTDQTTYPDYRLLVVDDGVLSAESSQLADAAGAQRLTYTGNGGDARGFNFSRKVNFALAHVQTEHFVLLNDDLEVLAPDWLEALMDYAVMPEVAAVGGRLAFADGRTQHAGVVARPGGPGHAFYGQPEERRTRDGSPLVVRDFAAVTGAVLASTLTTLHTVGPFDERLAHDYQDVDWCLRAGRLGFRIVYTPHCRLRHFEHASLARTAPAAEDHSLFMERWGDWIAHDPYYLQT